MKVPEPLIPAVVVTVTDLGPGAASAAIVIVAAMLPSLGTEMLVTATPVPETRIPVTLPLIPPLPEKPEPLRTTAFEVPCIPDDGLIATSAGCSGGAAIVNGSVLDAIPPGLNTRTFTMPAASGTAIDA